uniref:Uncharacterized protein n=1 Tax=Anguilla anguilla TaxID=7936 RepID=A0A0E9V805_ANGAN
MNHTQYLRQEIIFKRSLLIL